MSAGLGSVPAEQTFLDISQGNRVFESLYDSDLPRRVRGGICGPPYSPAVVERAESAPADIVPGLLEATLRVAGRGCQVRNLGLDRLRSSIAGLSGADMLIAVERPPPEDDEALAIGIAASGFEGNLTSDSTRTDGYVLSTDLAPTILRRFGLAVPSQTSGRPIRAEGSVDPAAVEALGGRMATISGRRGPVLGTALAAWLLGLALTALVGGRRAARAAVRLVGLSVVLLPLVLLVAAAVEPAEWPEAALALAAPPALALLALALAAGYRALALAAGLTALAYAVDAVAGSGLIALSLLGPNPGLGVRFYGIGNELEALLSVLVVAGTGAALAGFAPRAAPRAAAISFVVVGVAFAFVFAAGRFGADVGAAIVLPFGAVVAAATTAPMRRRGAALALAAPIGAVALLALLDLATGANAHLTRSVLDAGGLGEAGEVAQRRLQLSAGSFTRPVVLAFLPILVAVAVAAAVGRARIAAWLSGRAAMRAGLLGALAAVLLGAVANDSGALVLEIGAVYLLVFLGYAWSASGESDRPSDRRQKIYTSVSHS